MIQKVLFSLFITCQLFPSESVTTPLLDQKVRNDRNSYLYKMNWIIPQYNEYIHPHNAVNSSDHIQLIQTMSKNIIISKLSKKNIPHYRLPFCLFLIACIVFALFSLYHFTQTLTTPKNGANTNQMITSNVQIILDYDDTIFPTQYIQTNINKGIVSSQYIEESEWKQLHELNHIVYNTLLMFIQLFGASNVCIISNARLSWLDQSCTTFNGLYQNIRDLVIQNKIQVVSASDSYRSQKLSAFVAVLRGKANINKIISIGDSHQEFNDIDIACSVLRAKRRRQQNGSIHYCRFKLADRPSLSTMIEQMQNIRQLDYVMISRNQYNESYHI